MRLDLDSLHTLEVVVREGGLARAAQRLHRVQSAVSYQLRKLEQALGIQLLNREGYRMRLTPAGEAVLAEGRRLLTQAAHIELLARQFAEGWEPRLTLIVDGILPLEPTLAALKTMADERIPTRIQVRVEFLKGVQYRFDKDEADLMLVKDYDAHANLVAEPFAEIECILCAAPSHPLAGRKSVSLSDLHEQVELSVQDSSDQGDDRHMFGGERVFYLSGFIPKKQALLMGVGFGWMPKYLVARELRQGELKEVRYSGGSRYSFKPALVRRQAQPLGRAGQRLIELLRAQSHSVVKTRKSRMRPQ